MTLRNEIALVIGVVVSVLVIVAQVLTGDLTWAAAAPLIATVIVRQFVTPATKTDPSSSSERRDGG